MLRIVNVKKQYRTGNLVQNALNGVSLNLRDNEFVSILGPSGSGKTTLLNIIGGLDVYDEGDLIINNISTRDYKDRDWDAYRAHTIGFVFQSYNLIPHQTILANVELALTISGLSRAQRKGKALEALRKVGLAEHAHKRPNQLSGGQMQRVAIARALVNDPDILLADEPTGALDSDTSIQVMELLKEVASDRLVVMVTHNPELAAQYSTRIVRLKDGRIISDSDPLEIDKKTEAPESRKIGKAGMGILTAMHLSLNNLWTKKTRTLLVAFAGSIGIIGIALIMSLSNGANDYIRSTEEKTLSEYPLQISRASLDMTSMMTVGEEIMSIEDDDRIHENQILSGLFGTVRENDLASLKSFLDSGQSGVDPLVNAVEYTYDILPVIYKITDGSARQVSPDTVISSSGFSSLSSFIGSSRMNTFQPLPSEPRLYEPQYDVLAGRWPEKYNELVLVLSQNNTVSDLLLYNMGLKDPKVLDELMTGYQSGSTEYNVELGNPGSWSYDEILGIEFRLVNASDQYAYDKDLGIWIAQNGSSRQITALAEKGEPLTIVGIVRPGEEITNPVLMPGIVYPDSLIHHIMEEAAGSEIVRAQQETPDINIFTGKRFDDETTDFDFASLFNFDEEAIGDLFSFDAPDLMMDESAFDDFKLDFGNTDLGSMIDPSALSGAFSGLTEGGIESAFKGVTVNLTQENMTALFTELYDGFTEYASGDPRTDISGLRDALKAYFDTEEPQTILTDVITQIIDNGAEAVRSSEGFRGYALSLLEGYVAYITENGLTAETLPGSAALYMETEAAQAVLQAAADTASGIMKDTAAASSEPVREALSTLLSSYNAYAEANGLPVPEEIAAAYTGYLNTEQVRRILTDAAEEMIDMDTLRANLNGIASNVGTTIGTTIGAQITAAMQEVGSQIAEKLQTAISDMMTGYMSDLSAGFDFSPDMLENLVDINMSAESMKEMLAEMYSNTTVNADMNLKSLGFADISDPESITFYPVDFDAKNAVVDILNGYNDRMKAAGDEDKVIIFSDVVGALMTSVTKIINIIGYVLIAFVAISLIVSSIMIGVITYISVLERRKEIGILRAMGASKHNITQVFNCETMITGFLAGLIGVLVTWLILIPGNMILQNLTGQPDLRAFLPESSAALLVLLSVFLTAIGGLIPSKGAARQDPVIALRSE